MKKLITAIFIVVVAALTLAFAAKHGETLNNSIINESASVSTTDAKDITNKYIA